MRHAKIIVFLIMLLMVGSVHALEQKNDNAHWAFNKSPRPPIPDQSSLRHASRVRNPVDVFILKRLQEADLEPAPETDRNTLVRRAYFDLLGMPPSPEQVDTFLADTSDEAWPKLIEELLASKLVHKMPVLLSEDISSLNLEREFNFVWASSVLIHFKDEILEDCFAFVSSHLSKQGKFYANVNIGNKKDDSWKGFPVVWRTLDFYKKVGSSYGLTVQDIGSRQEFGFGHSDIQRMLEISKK